MRLLLDDRDTVPAAPGSEVAGAALADLYAEPAARWWRANMISTVDGAATGDSGTSGSINNAADKQVFDLLRSRAQAIVVGAGTARAEGYREAAVPLVVVSGRGEVPDSLRSARPGGVLLATGADAPGLSSARRLLGAENVMVLGESGPDLAALRAEMDDRGLHRVLCEGGPGLLADLFAAGRIDELCLTLAGTAVGGLGPRILRGGPLRIALRPVLLLLEEDTVLGRWWVRRD